MTSGPFINTIKALPDLRYIGRIAVRQPYPFPKRDFRGTGYLAGEFPGGTTTVESMPVSAEVRVLWRDPEGGVFDGDLVRSVQSGPDGTWAVYGIALGLKYDVVGRKEGFNDVIVAGVMPTSMVDIVVSGAITSNASFDGAQGTMTLMGGVPPYTVVAVSTLPVGLFPLVEGRSLIVDGTTADETIGTYTVEITSSNGAQTTADFDLIVGFKAPQNVTYTVTEEIGVFAVHLSWEEDSVTDSINVYRSSAPISADALPTPLATITAGVGTYTDTDVIEDQNWFYRLESICQGGTLVSEQVRVDVAEADPHWENVVALVHFDGDYSDSAGAVWTPAPNTTISTTAKFGGGAMYSDGYAGISASGERFNFGTADYTIEGFWKADAINRSFFAWDGGKRVLYVWANGYSYWNGSINAITGIAIKTTDFVHIAFTRESGVARLFIDGVLAGTYLYDSFATTSNSVRTGNFGTVNLSGGYTDELRITKGVARYTEAFTPPTKQFPNR